MMLAVTVLTVLMFGQAAAKTVTATEIVKQIEAGKGVDYENTTVTGDFDLSNLPNRMNDATYPENGKTARVYSAKITAPISFKNVVFRGKLDFFRKEAGEKEIKEFRLIFAKAVKFENCTFNETADFELTNFDGGISFESSVFKAKPSFIRIGLEKTPNFTKTIFENGSIFKNFQSDSEQNLTAEKLENFYRNYLESIQ